MPRPATLPTVACRRPGHEVSHVSCKGHRTLGDGRVRQRYLCVMPDGSKHQFTEKAKRTGVVDASPPPACPEHPRGVVALAREYATTPLQPRQLYSCDPPAGEGKPHTFTPALPRERVRLGLDDCDACEELRGLHHGDQAVARRHSWTARQVADGLRKLSEGKSYGEVSREARVVTHRSRTRAGAARAAQVQTAPPSGPPLVRRPGNGSRGTRLSRNSWHIAADWCETFSPVLWRYVDGQLHASDQDQRRINDLTLALGRRLVAPQVLLLDDIPINAKAGASSSRRDWFVLVASQVTWHRQPGSFPGDPLESGQRLRAVRAFPTNDHNAWKLLLAELDYRPDFVVADAGKGLGKAVADRWGGAVPLIPSLWHLRHAIETGLYDKTPGAWTQVRRGARKELLEDLETHLRGLRRTQVVSRSPAEWSQWWDELLDLLRSNHLSVKATQERRDNYEDVVAKLLPTFRLYPQVPLATGGLELAIRRKVEPLLAGRARSFANIERTNSLLDLAVCADFGLFLNPRLVVSLLREDSFSDYYGWSTPLRSVTDPHPLDPFAPTPAPGRVAKRVRYSSLRDQQLLRTRVRLLELT